jgi:DNA-binding helix-hairpin-helix protein with protein kinase domain
MVGGIVDTCGNSVTLGKEIGKGGEGAVFEIASDDKLLAKIYHSGLSSERADKIRVMSALRGEQIAKLTAWPIDLLSTRSGQPVGLLIPRFAGRKDIHHLYSPKSRRADFQRADWRFLIRAAANTARAFAAVHETGCVIGDVNHGGVLVAQDATVRLIDCDSFQVVSGSRKFLCEVGVETFTPPELQGKPFKGVVRTESHDNFGLAVMSFLMLFMGRHPFAGRYLGSGDMPIPRAIEEFRFAYGSRRAALSMERPPGTPPLNIVGDGVEALFERAFSRDHAIRRPRAKEWAVALEQLETSVKQCPSSPSHWHHKSTSYCPWCQMEAATGAALFPIIVQTATGSLFDLTTLWQQVESLKHPGSAPAFRDMIAQPSDEAKATLSQIRKNTRIALSISAAIIGFGVLGLAKGFGILFILAGIVAYFTIHAILDKAIDTQKYKTAFVRATSNRSMAQSGWTLNAGPGQFDTKMAELLMLKRERSDIPSIRLRRMEQLRKEHRKLQLEQFLDTFQIDDAKIDGVGPGRKQTLASFSIETALDVTEKNLSNVSGFGPKLRSNMLLWRRSIEMQFVFDPKRAIDPRQIQKVEQEIIVEKNKIEDKLHKGVAEITQIHKNIINARQYMKKQVEAAYLDYANAAANYQLIFNKKVS